MLFWHLELNKNYYHDQGEHTFHNDRQIFEVRDLNYDVAMGRLAKAVALLGFDAQKDLLEIRLRSAETFTALGVWAVDASVLSGTHPLTASQRKALGLEAL